MLLKPLWGILERTCRVHWASGLGNSSAKADTHPIPSAHDSGACSMKSCGFTGVCILWLAGAAIAFACLSISRPTWLRSPHRNRSRHRSTTARRWRNYARQSTMKCNAASSPACRSRWLKERRRCWKRDSVADREHQIPAAADTLYRVGSISKLFTAVAVMQLVEAGKLDLDDAGSEMASRLPHRRSIRISFPHNAASADVPPFRSGTGIARRRLP